MEGNVTEQHRRSLSPSRCACTSDRAEDVALMSEICLPDASVHAKLRIRNRRKGKIGVVSPCPKSPGKGAWKLWRSDCEPNDALFGRTDYKIHVTLPMKFLDLPILARTGRMSFCSAPPNILFYTYSIGIYYICKSSGKMGHNLTFRLILSMLILLG